MSGSINPASRAIFLFGRASSNPNLVQMLATEFDLVVPIRKNHEAFEKGRLPMASGDIIILSELQACNAALKDIRNVRTLFPEALLFLLVDGNPFWFESEAYKLGVSACLEGRNAGSRLISAIHRVLSGQRYFDPNYIDHLVESMMLEEHAPHERLTELEFRVLCQIASGKRSGQIAGMLLTDPENVRDSRKALLRKMKMRTNRELQQYARENGLEG
jgi:two-component system, NarL family, invasion response regulator UvrY